MNIPNDALKNHDNFFLEITIWSCVSDLDSKAGGADRRGGDLVTRDVDVINVRALIGMSV